MRRDSPDGNPRPTRTLRAAGSATGSPRVNARTARRGLTTLAEMLDGAGRRDDGGDADPGRHRGPEPGNRRHQSRARVHPRAHDSFGERRARRVPLLQADVQPAGRPPEPVGSLFGQRFTLLHRDVGAPTVMFTSGYNVSELPNRSEPTQIVNGNQLSMEYRYVTPSRPENNAITPPGAISVAVPRSRGAG